MKSLSFFLTAMLLSAWQQPAPAPAANAQTDGDKVIAVFEDGTKVTASQFRAMIPGLPQNYLQLAQQDPGRFFHYYAMMRDLARMAEKDKLDQHSPNKEALEFARMSTLADIKMKDVMNSTTVSPEEVRKAYDDNKETYKQVKVSAIYVAFDDGDAAAATPKASNASKPAKKALTEKEAQAKAEKLVADIKAGADFRKLVKENSDDETSRDKGGDFGTWKISEQVPDLLRGAVFSLKKGEISGAVRQAHGFYIFLADDITYVPFEQVKDTLFQQVKTKRAQEWVQKVDADTKVTIVKDAPESK